jgi:nicotinamide-nucleotide amidase
MLAPVVEELTAIAPYYYGRDEETLASVLGRMLKEANQTMATAESCTSGLLASRMTDVPGATAYIKGGVVPYDSEYKAKLLGVPREKLDAGSVNQPVAEGLAEGARRMFETDWGVGITGFAGPGVDVADEDVGLVWIAVAGPDGTTAERWRYGTKMPRETIKFRATQTAMDMLRRRLITLEGQSPS